MLHRVLISTAILSAISVPALAQNNDAALKEEIRKISAYNAQTASSAHQDAKIKLLAEPTTELTYGNTPIHQKPVSAITPRSPATYTRIHRVVENDTLYNLAKRNCIAVVDIQKHNAMNNNNIRIGQTLSLPASKCNSTSPATLIPTQSTSRVTTGAMIKTQPETGVVRKVMPIKTGVKIRTNNAYAVLPKDSLYSIGRRYCVSAGELAAFNKIETATAIQPGQILRLPQKACN